MSEQHTETGFTARTSLRCQLLVIGAGPAGIAAALRAAEHGVDVLLIDQQAMPGGQIWRGQWRVLAENPAQCDALAAPMLTALQQAIAAGNIRFLGSCRVVLAVSEKQITTDGEQAADIQFEKLIVATGARELFLPFPGWTLPGVTGAGALQVMAKDGADLRGKRVVVAGSGPLLLAVAASLRKAGAKVCLIAEQQNLSALLRFAGGLWKWPALLLQALQLRLQTLRTPYRSGVWITRAEGQGALQRVHWQNTTGETGVIDCDWLACGFGLLPNHELLALLNAAPLATHALRSSRDDVFLAGEMTGIGGVRRALLSGTAAADLASGKIGAEDAPDLRAWNAYADALENSFALRKDVKQLAQPGTVICRCESVRFDAVQRCSSFREAKLATRFAMGPCQGRICGAAARSLFAWPLAHTRAPLAPTPVSSFLQTAAQCSASPVNPSSPSTVQR